MVRRARKEVDILVGHLRDTTEYRLSVTYSGDSPERLERLVQSIKIALSRSVELETQTQDGVELSVFYKGRSFAMKAAKKISHIIYMYPESSIRISVQDGLGRVKENIDVSV